ncbi:MAG: GntR family transcriptional regulator [Chloroflexi bacterium]|nr:GntR family transcriptional regulator [Chloroflexota bacterium]
MSVTYRTMQGIVYDTIREAILEGRYKPGQRLVADDLAKELGVSRMPIREALQRLEVIGLVTSAPHRGTSVSELSEIEIIEIYHIRAVLEGLAARLATPHLTCTHHQQLNDLLIQMEQSTSTQEIDQILQLNHAFHLIIWNAADAPRLLVLMENLYDASRRFRRTSLQVPGRLAQIAQEHRKMLKALMQRDVDLAERYAIEHHEITATILLDSIHRNHTLGK